MYIRGTHLVGVIVLTSLVTASVVSTAIDDSTTRIQPVQLNGTAETNTSVYKQAYQTAMDSVVSIKVITRSGSSRGTGFVYDDRQHIVTNHHVVQDAQRVEVKFRDGQWRSAEIVGTDIYSDLAVLRVEELPSYAAPLPIARQNPVPGTRVMALGNPFGLQETITQGIISGVNRTMETTGGFTIPDTIQTDAPINPGNSGGPLINQQGAVVGVNRAKQGDNIGFAISPRIVRRVVPALIQDGQYDHPYIGIGMEEVSPIIAEANDLDAARGVIVTGVTRQGPSSGILEGSERQVYTQAGAVPIGGDIILSIDGRRVQAPRDVSGYLATRTSPGATITMTILRDEQQQQVEIEVGTRPQLQRYSQLPY